jgi:sugar phosphate isomerase/epimerase
MRIGCVAASLHEAQVLASLGYDYLEIKGDLLMGDNAHFDRLEQILSRLPILVEALISPLPRSLGLRVTGPRPDTQAAVRTFEQICTRAAYLGARVVTFGCGQARRVEDGFPPGQAREQLRDFLRLVADCCQAHNLVVAVETLNHSETNLLNRTGETRELVEQTQRAEIGMLIDFYHVWADGLPLHEEMEGVKCCLMHAHTADPGRRYPGAVPQAQRAFLVALKELGYDNRLTVECDFSAYEQEALAALTFLRQEA